nr:MAG TPA: hypothetical protein [Caudoviricetes sp.]
MAKARMVTRTIVRTEVVALCANKQAESIENVTITVTGAYKDEKALVKAVIKALPATHAFLSIKSTTVNEILYGMTEAEFVANATEISKNA